MVKCDEKPLLIEELVRPIFKISIGIIKQVLRNQAKAQLFLKNLNKSLVTWSNNGHFIIYVIVWSPRVIWKYFPRSARALSRKPK